jgi:hypothetical protein
VIDEAAELARAPRRAPLDARELPEEARAGVRAGIGKLLAWLIGDAEDAQLERRFGSAFAQRALFVGMARSFAPEAAAGFQGSLVCELARPATAGEPLLWTIEVVDGRASARPGTTPDPALTVRFPLGDFLRVAAGLLDPAVPLLEDRATLEGDLAVAARLPEMFAAWNLSA